MYYSQEKVVNEGNTADTQQGTLLVMGEEDLCRVKLKTSYCSFKRSLPVMVTLDSLHPNSSESSVNMFSSLLNKQNQCALRQSTNLMQGDMLPASGR